MDRTIDWNDRYVSGDLPWDTGRCDFNLREMVATKRIQPCKTLEVGCGTGTNAICLSHKGFRVTGVDVAGKAIECAIEKACKAGVRCKFYKADFMTEKIAGGPFGFVFDRGCFHSFASARDRGKYAKRVHSYLVRSGTWLTLAGSRDEPPRLPGPPQLSAGEIAAAVEPYFRIISLYTSHFDSRMRTPPKAWVCLMQKR